VTAVALRNLVAALEAVDAAIAAGDPDRYATASSEAHAAYLAAVDALDGEARADRAPSPAGDTLDAAPLLAALDQRGGVAAVWRAAFGEPFIGANGQGRGRSVARAVQRARDTGRITRRAADVIAVDLLGMHPMDVFGDAWLLERAEAPA
jgi:hypothetical protein